MIIPGSVTPYRRQRSVTRTHSDFPIVVIPKSEFRQLWVAAGRRYSRMWELLKRRSKEYGLVFNSVNRRTGKVIGPGIRAWWNDNGDFCQQNFTVEEV